MGRRGEYEREGSCIFIAYKYIYKSFYSSILIQLLLKKKIIIIHILIQTLFVFTTQGFILVKTKYFLVGEQF